MRRGSPILVVLFVAALVFSSCSEPQTTAWDGELTIHVNDALPKTISYDGIGVDEYGSANVSHYKVDVYEDDMTGEPVTTTGFVAAKSGNANVFTIKNLINRTYVINVGGYIRTGNTGTDSDYYLISEDSTSFYADYSAVDPEVTLTLKTLAEGTSAVTISAAMPIDFVDPADHTISGELSWQLLDIENPKTVIDSGKVTLTDAELYEESVGLGQYATDEWLYDFTLDDPVDSGLHLVYVIFKGGESYDYAAMDIIRALPGLPSTGVMVLDRALPFPYSFSVTDMIGNPLTVGADKGVYTSPDGNVDISITEGLDNGHELIWFVDGVYKEPAVSDGVYRFEGLQTGRRYITAVVWDNDKQAEIGAVQIAVEVEASSVIGPAGK